MKKVIAYNYFIVATYSFILPTNSFFSDSSFKVYRLEAYDSLNLLETRALKKQARYGRF